METLIEDLKKSLRLLTKSPGFTFAAIAALSLGIGANTAIFSVVNAVMLRPLPFPDAERIVLFTSVSPQGSGSGASPAKFQHFREQTEVTEHVAAFRTGTINYTGGDFPEELQSSQVSAELFALFGAPFALGRGFTAAEDLPGGGHVAVLSDALWTSRYQRDPAIIGKPIALNGEPYTIVGVLGNFDVSEFGPQPAVWTPFQLDPSSPDQGHYFQVAGRIKAGVSLAQAQARLTQSAAAYRTRYPGGIGDDESFSVEPLRERLIGDVRTSLMVLTGAVGFVLLIACANVANLLLIRATGRQRELAVRAALGASRWRIARQLLTESVVLSLCGGVLGLVFGIVGIRSLLAIDTAGLPRVGASGALVQLDWRVLGFTLLVSLATGVVFGLIPALHSARANLSPALKEGGGRSGTGLRQNKARSLLVVSEVALALILLVGSALLIRSALALSNVDAGFDTKRVLTLRTALTDARFKAPGAVDQVVVDGIERLRAIPGVEDASASGCVPLEGCYGLPFKVLGRPLTDGDWHGNGSWVTVAHGYFETFKIPIKRGRAFTDRDNRATPGVAIINEAMARQFWPDGDPLNDRLVIGRGVMKEFAGEIDRQIIGVVGDTRDSGLDSEPQPTMYIPQLQVPEPVNELNLKIAAFAWIVRTQGAPYSLNNAIQEQLRQATGVSVASVRSMDEIRTRSTSRQRFNTWLMAVFGGCALALAAIGIYGLMAYSVQQRSQEMGVRLALGADAAQVKRMVVGQGMRLALIGIAVGLTAAFVLARLIASLLFGVGTADPLVFIGVPLVLAGVALLAVWLPARRASRVDPIVALRYE